MLLDLKKAFDRVPRVLIASSEKDRSGGVLSEGSDEEV